MALTGTSSLAVIPSRSEWFNVVCALISKFGVTSAWNVMAIMGHELYPTVLRHRGMGAAYVVGRIGAICGPFMKNLTTAYGLVVVLVMYASLSFIAAILALFMPETKGQEIPDTIEEAEHVILEFILLFEINRM
ncbi:unnamed protein product [Oppiella nova]|uniref:Major facilitator superfamily (MFS) profile domain-containing protein n=1 Tax=Oppiella nova TaxID=334625 RepID=A0A7R9MKV2_9ACAR|nr:unnamed protein product [Oppiella nova]CAG2179267.1 unnamed protein product [Oppiella nova]